MCIFHREGNTIQVICIIFFWIASLMGGRARESFYELIKGLQGNYDITRSLTIP